MREKKFGKLFLTWLLAATMVLTLLPVSMLAMDAPGEAEDGEVVLAPVAGVEEEEAAPVEAVPMLLAAPAAEDTPIAVPTDKLFFDKANGVITGIDADWLAENKDKPLSVTIPAEIGGVAEKELLLSISAMQPIWRRSTIRHLCTLRWHRLTCPILR